MLRTAARKRRMAVLRQLSAPPADDPADVLGSDDVDETEDLQEFIAACGVRMPLRLVVTDERTGEKELVLVDHPYAVIGGAEECDVRLIHPDVSQHHAYLQCIEGRVLCCDLGSRTGTHWGTVIRSRNWLSVGEPIYVGPYSIRQTADDLDDGTRPLDQSATLSQIIAAGLKQPAVALKFVNARSRSGRSKLSRIRHSVTLVGWSHLCNLRLQHHSVGRVHCSLVWTRSGLWVVDLRCQGGTTIDGTRVISARLNDRAELEVGRFHLRVSLTTSRGGSARAPHRLEPPASGAGAAKDLLVAPRSPLLSSAAE